MTGTRKGIDPRCYQIGVLSMLVSYGVWALGFGITAAQAVVTVTTALFVQWAGTRLFQLPRFDPLSALITSLSLTLLFRTDVLALAAVAAALAIGSKFLIRYRGKHVFNPANFAIVALMFASDRAWISSGQWGSATIIAILLTGLGLVVLNRARRAETTLSFLSTFALLIFARAWWLGDPVSIPLHQLQNGAVLIFAFFMISDPRTTPDSASGRILFGALVALLACVIQFGFFQPHGPVIALACLAPLVPLIDVRAAGNRYEWRFARSVSSIKGVS